MRNCCAFRKSLNDAYLLDTNHLSAYLDDREGLSVRIDSAIRSGRRFGVCLPTFCEYRAGIRVSRYRQRNMKRLERALTVFRVWPMDDTTIDRYAELYGELRARGRMLAQFDLLIAAIARRRKLVLLTADADFDVVEGLRIRSWLNPPR